MASTVWKGYITFGLISIPVRLFVAARGEHISFNQLHDKCKTRVKYQLYCPTCERVVERSEIVKGYEYEKNTFVVVDEEDIQKVAPPSADMMEILEFVKLGDIDPVFYDVSYYVVPEDPGRKAYKLLLETMNATKHVAVAKAAMHQREHIVLIRPQQKGLALHTMFYENEVRSTEYKDLSDIDVKPQEIKLAEQLVESLSGPFDASKYADTYQQKLTELIEAKSQGSKPVTPKRPHLAPVIDLQAALERSLARADRKQPEKAETAEAPARRRQTAQKKAARG